MAIWEECHIKQVAGTCFGETFISTCGKHGIYDENGEIGLEANEKVGKIYLDWLKNVSTNNNLILTILFWLLSQSLQFNMQKAMEKWD